MENKKYLSGEELEPGLKYQDFITIQLYLRGIPINCIYSRKSNIEIGESLAGYEIKWDHNFDKTGNLYIEYAERHDVNKPLVNSGILREDNTGFWVIGNYEEAYIFKKKQLKALCKMGYKKNIFRAVDGFNGKSKGILLPIKWLEENPIWYDKLDFTKDKEIIERWARYLQLVKEN